MAGEVSDAAWNSAQAEIDAQGGVSSDLDWEQVAQAAAGGAAAAACTAYGLGAAAPLCSYVGSELAGFVIEEVGPAIADAWDSIFGSEPEKPSLIGPLSDEQKWLGYWGAMSSDMATTTPLIIAVNKAMQAAAEIAPGNWTTETVLGWLQECGAGFEWRTGLSVDNRRFSGWQNQCFHVEAPDAPCTYRDVAVLSIVPEKPVLTAAWWLPDWPKRFRELYPFDNTVATLGAYVQDNVYAWWDRFYGNALPCLTVRLQTEAIALRAELAAAEFQSRQLAELAALPPGDLKALQDWAALAAMSPEDAQALRDWAALAALSEEERAQLRAWVELSNLPPAERARLAVVAKATSPRNFGRFGAVVAAPIGASA